MPCLSVSDWGNFTVEEKVLRSMPAIRYLESGSLAGVYTAQNSTTTASGAYQIVETTWRGLSKLSGYGGKYSQAKHAPKEVQDKVAYDAFVNILKKRGGDISAIPLEWFGGTGIADTYYGGDTGLLARRTPGSQTGWAQTWGGYVNRFSQVVLCGEVSGELLATGGLVIKKFPVKVGDKGEDVLALVNYFKIKQHFGDRFGTGLQYFIMRFQLDNNLPLTGEWSEVENNLAAPAPPSDSGGAGSTEGLSDISGDLRSLVDQVLSNKRIDFSGSNPVETKYFRTGIRLNDVLYLPSERMLRFMLTLSQIHTFSISSTTDHPTYIAGTSSVSSHVKLRAFDINYIDNNHLVSTPVSKWDVWAREFMSFPSSSRPIRIGMTDYSRIDDRNGVIVFKNAGHRNHFHLGFE